MRHRNVVFSEEARLNLIDLYNWLLENTEPETALSYIERLEEYCLDFDIASERGECRDDIRPGLRVVGFEKRIAIAFTVEEEQVIILRLFYGGQDWTHKV